MAIRSKDPDKPGWSTTEFLGIIGLAAYGFLEKLGLGPAEAKEVAGTLVGKLTDLTVGGNSVVTMLVLGAVLWRYIGSRETIKKSKILAATEQPEE